MGVEGEEYTIKREHLISLAKNSGLDVLSGKKYVVSKATIMMIKEKINESFDIFSLLSNLENFC